MLQLDFDKFVKRNGKGISENCRLQKPTVSPLFALTIVKHLQRQSQLDGREMATQMGFQHASLPAHRRKFGLCPKSEFCRADGCAMGDCKTQQTAHCLEKMNNTNES